MKIKIEVTMINKIQHVQILFNSVKVILTDILVHYQISLCNFSEWKILTFVRLTATKYLNFIQS